VTAGVSVKAVSGVAAVDFGVFFNDSAVAFVFAPAIDAPFTSTAKGEAFSTTFVHIVSGDGGATIAAATADLVFCMSRQHFEQNPLVALFPCENSEDK
jgi:hypothetical protein